MNEEFLSLTISANISKCRTIFSKNTFVSFETLILMLIKKYLIIFVYLLIITKIELYTTLLRLLKDKSMMKFIKFLFQDISDINKKFNYSYNL